MPYAVHILSAAERQLADLPKPERDELRAAILTLADNPRPAPPAGKKLRGQPTRYRLRVRGYRVIYRIDAADRAVTVVWVGNRRDAYRD